MPNSMLLKSFNLFFSKFKCLPTITFSPPNPIDDEEQGPKFNNFDSLYDANSDSTSAAAAIDSDGGDADALPDFTSAFASHRFFFSSPGSSNSIFEEAPHVRPQPLKEYSGGGVAVLRYSGDPYGDFRESMEEMIAARGLTEVGVDWDFLHELLLSYLTLNPKNAHDFIISAFVDVIISLVLPPEDDTCPKT